MRALRQKHSQPLSILSGVEADGLYGCHDNGHAERHGNEEHDDVLGPVFQGHLLVLVFLRLLHCRTGGGRVPVLLGASALASPCARTSPGPQPRPPLLLLLLLLLAGLRARSGLGLALL